MTHLKWIDVSKGTGIILVIIGHNNFNPNLMKNNLYISFAIVFLHK